MPMGGFGVAFFDSAYDTVPKPITASWQALEQELGRLRVCPGGRKDRQRRISPVEYLPGTERASTHVLRATFLMADFDKLAPDRMLHVLGLVRDLRCIMYTTWSHPERHEADGTWSFRLAVPFTRPVEAREWKGFYRRLQSLFDWLIDPQCVDLSKMYILPASPRDDRHFFASQDGRPLDVDAVMSVPLPEAVPAPAGTRRLSRDDLLQLAKSLARRSSDGATETAGILRAIAAGRQFAEPGGRDRAMFMAASRIAERWPDVDAASVVALAAPSLSAMSRDSPDCPGVGVLEDKVRRACERIADEQARMAAARQAAISEGIREAFGGQRSEPYTDEEMKRFRAEGFTGHWIVQASRGYYLFRARLDKVTGLYRADYMPAVCREALPVAARSNLAPASSQGFDLYKLDKDGEPRLRQAHELLEDAAYADRVIVDMTADRMRFDEESKTMVEAPCPMRAVAPLHSAHVDVWLRTLGGEKQEKLLDWLATMPLLDRPTAALYIHGPPDAGKTLLGRGLARLWTEEGFTKFRDVLADFNDSLPSCPLVVADETVSRDMWKGGGTGRLRDLIQDRGMTLYRKHQPTAKLRGTLRLVIAANNKHLLDTGEELMPNDIRALCERFLYIEAPQAAADLLVSYGRDVVDWMVDGDGIAAHVLWLCDNRRVCIGSRFLVEGEASELQSSMATSYGLRSALCHWCVSYLMDRNRMDMVGGMRLVRVDDGQLLVTAKGLMDCWDMYPTNERPPTVGRLRKALAPIKEERRVQRKVGDGKWWNYYAIRTEELLRWAEDNSDHSKDDLLAALAQPTEAQ